MLKNMFKKLFNKIINEIITAVWFQCIFIVYNALDLIFYTTLLWMCYGKLPTWLFITFSIFWGISVIINIAIIVICGIKINQKLKDK